MKTNLNRKYLYAQSMGIDCWFPRYRLKGADNQKYIVSAINKEMSVSQSFGVSDIKNSSGKPQSGSIRAKLFDSLNEKASEKISVKLSQQGVGSQVVQNDAVAKEFIQPFSLVCIKHGDLFIVDDISGLNVVPSAYSAWLNAILVALGKSKLNRPLQATDSIRWPQEHIRSQSNNLEAASEMVKGWLGRKQLIPEGVPELKQCLLMGEMPRKFLFSNDSEKISSTIDEGSLGKYYQLDGLHSPAFVLPGTNDVWSGKISKKQLWYLLQKLSG